MQACQSHAAVEVLYGVLLTFLVEIGLGSLAMQRNVQEEGWFLVVSLFADLQRGFICRSLIRRIRRRRGQQAYQVSNIDVVPIWWCLIISIGMTHWSIAQTMGWRNDPISSTILGIFASLNLLSCVGWLAFLRACAQKPVPPALEVFTFQHDLLQPLPYGQSCLVCLGDMEDGDEVGQLLCGHAFHKNCIMEWWSVRPNCPMRCMPETTVAEGAISRPSSPPTSQTRPQGYPRFEPQVQPQAEPAGLSAASAEPSGTGGLDTSAPSTSESQAEPVPSEVRADPVTIGQRVSI